jgi:hypothetical protein
MIALTHSGRDALAQAPSDSLVGSVAPREIQRGQRYRTFPGNGGGRRELTATGVKLAGRRPIVRRTIRLARVRAGCLRNWNLAGAGDRRQQQIGPSLPSAERQRLTQRASSVGIRFALRTDGVVRPAGAYNQDSLSDRLQVDSV